jgi:molybdenum cofactor cytidylyltransferase
MDLTDALELGPREIVALVGGGGKTTAMYRLCVEAAAHGRSAVASGTARFTEPFGGATVPLLVDEDESKLAESVSAALATEPWVIAAAGRGSKERLQPLSYESVDRLARNPAIGLIALEADGSAMRPFKAPAEHEPALPDSATFVVAVVGADIFGRPLTQEAVHRPERVAALTGASLGDIVTPHMVAAVLAHPQGGRKGIPAAARFAVLINKVGERRLRDARTAASLLRERGVQVVVLAQVREERPVVEVLRPEKPWSQGPTSG